MTMCIYYIFYTLQKLCTLILKPRGYLYFQTVYKFYKEVKWTTNQQFVTVCLRVCFAIIKWSTIACCEDFLLFRLSFDWFWRFSVVESFRLTALSIAMCLLHARARSRGKKLIIFGWDLNQKDIICDNLWQIVAADSYWVIQWDLLLS